LAELQKNSLTGEWAKEVIKDLIVEQKGKCQIKSRKTHRHCLYSAESIVPQNVNKRASITILTVAGLAYSIFIFGGGLYTLILRPIPAYISGSQFFFVYPGISQQFISDTVVSAILYALGFVGLLIIYQSSKSAYKPRQAYMMLVVGVALLFLSYIFLEGVINFKSTYRG